MHGGRGLRVKGVGRPKFADDLAVSDFGDDPRANSETVALYATQADAQPILFWEIIFKQLERAATNLAHKEILSANVVEIQRIDAAAVAIRVGSGDEADVDKIFAGGIEKSAIALVAAEVVGHGNIKGVAGPKLVEAVIEFSGGRHLASAIERL